jgi:NADH:ubiquinone oxidoreductase subunit C
MDKENLKNRLLAVDPDATEVANCQLPTFTVSAGKLHAMVENLKNGNDTAFDYLFCQTAVDAGKELVVVYHLNSTKFGHDIVLKSAVEGRENPGIDSICDLYRAAEFYEREIFDLFGINFLNHPDMRRIFLDENWKGHPLRKDYVDEINIIEL